jgi:alkylation response protein AidB-like acyl-CoA dehydrogenase
MSDHSDIAAEIARTAQRVVAECDGLDTAAVARRLGEAGLLGVLAPEAVGGLGLPLSAVAPVVSVAEAGLLAFPLVETLLAARLLAETQPDLAAALVEGEAVLTIASAGSLSPGVSGVVGRAPLGTAAQWLLAPLGEGAVLLALDAPGVTVAEDPGFDLERPAARVSVTGATPAATIPAAAWATLRADALLLRAAGALGAAGHCMDRAIEHLTGRRQFGRPLVTMQGLRFSLARQKLALEGAWHALEHALALAGQDPQGESVPRLVARATCAEAAPAIIEGAIQLHGGMGFTWDLGLHRQLRRAKEAAAALDAVAARAALAGRLEEAWAL